MTTPTAESMKQAKDVLTALLTKHEGTLTKWPDGILDTQEAVATALDAAKAAGRAEGLKEASQLVRDSKCGGIEEDLADRIAALTATHGTKNEKTPPRAE